MWQQTELKIQANHRGFHLITEQIEHALKKFTPINIGVMHLFIKHSSASLTINENADPTVRSDMEKHFNNAIPENAHYYQHTYEGADDMPAHIKASVLGNSLTIPITKGRLNMGLWQGIYLGEHRNEVMPRTLVITVQGD